VEFISTVMFGKTVVDALDAIEGTLSKCQESWRAGIHVHVDVRDLDLHQLANVCILYGMLERIIFEWEGNSRDQSNFCVPWYVCNEAATAVGEVLNATSRLGEGTEITQHQFGHINRLGKYSALNILPVVRQGSIEFRMMQSTSDVARILEFVNICMTIVKVAKEVEQNPLLVLSELGPERFIDEYIKLPQFKGTANYEENLWRGVDVGNIIPVQANNIRLDEFNNTDNELPIL